MRLNSIGILDFSVVERIIRELTELLTNCGLATKLTHNPFSLTKMSDNPFSTTINAKYTHMHM